MNIKLNAQIDWKSTEALSFSAFPQHLQVLLWKDAVAQCVEEVYSQRQALLLVLRCLRQAGKIHHPVRHSLPGTEVMAANTYPHCLRSSPRKLRSNWSNFPGHQIFQ